MSAITAGSLLVATPMLEDPNFRHAVVYIAEHNEDGTLGFILNRPLDLPLDEVWDGCPDSLTGLRCCAQGGPVETHKGLLLHGYEQVPGAGSLCAGVWIGGDGDAIRAAASDDPEMPCHGPRLILGHAGWSEGQLAGEIGAGAWAVRPGDARLLLNPDPPEDLWQTCLGAGDGPRTPSTN
ncbi:MAG: YqgE/AlgH family protein [Planctomycetota bacterium]